MTVARRITGRLFWGCHCHAAKENERAKRERNPRHLPLVDITLSLPCEEQKSQNPHVKHGIARLAILAIVFTSLVVSAPITFATDLRGVVVGHAGALVGVGVALFEVKPDRTLHRVRETVTAPNGNYYFSKVHPGQYVLRIRKIDYPLEVRETEIQDIPVITASRH
jgi:hypothetical protein